ncbi:cytochrome P450 [Actimicrobium antarcticum]|uniref:Cytochrome P450 n=1 Tax=Actimicrobium antarcticum TaxID=1051899 RepID=A0ABP7SWV1_9BURK
MPETRSPLRNIRDLPGPPTLPLLGNVHQIKPHHVHRIVEQWCVLHGDFFRMMLGSKPVLVVADHVTIGAILRERPAGYRRPAVTEKVSREMGGIPGVFLAEGDDWRNQRRMVMTALSPTAVKAYFPALVRVALRLQRRWDEAARTQTPIDLSADLKRYTVDIIAGLAFGTDVNTIDSGEDRIQQHLDRILPKVALRSLAMFPYWRYLKLPSDRRLDRSVVALKNAIGDLIAQAHVRLDTQPERRQRPGNLLEAMLVAASEPDSGVTDQTVSGNVTTMLLAGEDTTANTIAWMLYLLHAHPDALQRAQQEVRRIAPDPAAYTIEQMDALDYVDACAQEAMRLKPVAPYLPVEALQDTVIRDIAVPAGTLVWCVMRHHSVDDRFFADANRFHPQRWLEGDDGNDDNAVDKRIAMPFGAGVRTCPGRYLALLEIKMAIALVLGQFDLASVGTDGGQEPRELMAFVMSPVGLTMTLLPRRDQ